MATPAVRTEHTRDVVDLYADIANNTLPAASFVKPSELVDGHPLSLKLDLFEAFLRNIVERVEAKPDLFSESAIDRSEAAQLEFNGRAGCRGALGFPE